ncbi:EboA domain-containing protein [Streptomyces sp. NPDC014894]|uniref:EboA domain-containing protein n=1 Tax=unclassified Streptomyces TaxID=2593676 RepID=UPI0036FF6CB3
MLIPRTRLDTDLDPAARDWLDHALTEAAARRPGWETAFATAGRHCGPLNADPVRTLLLNQARPDPPTLTRLYRHGTAAERRALLLALPHLHHLTPPDAALPLVHDALRTNDTRLVAAAVGPYAARHLDAHSWRHAVLKCLFTGVPLDTVAALRRRARGDRELARMLADYAAERTAAGRTTPPDLIRAQTLTGEPPEET